MRLGEEMVEEEHFKMLTVKNIDGGVYTGLAQLRKVELRCQYDGRD